MNVRVVVNLPYNRPENPPNDPPQIEWNAEKASILWEVIEKSRAVDNAATDWTGLAAHLQVPLPYLLYRVNARFQEELRGIRDIGILSPTTTQSPKGYNFPAGDKQAPSLATRVTGSTRLSRSRQGTPLGVRARLSSLGTTAPRPRKATSSSTLTLHAPPAAAKLFSPLRPTSPSSSEGDSGEDEEDAIREEEADRNAEEEETLSRKLEELQRMMTNDALGLVSGTRPKDKDKGKTRDRGRSAPLSPRSLGSSRVDTLSSRSMSQSVSSAGSIPDIPSQSSGSQSQSRSQPQSPGGPGTLGHKSGSPPAVSSRSAVGVVHRRLSEYGSNHGSEASSFSDLSDASISASVLESALLSGLGTNGSRFSQISRTRNSNRIHTVVPQ
ncbi:hypothetical protein BDN70DRAFT_881696 [Pholiota conissans]|uniref:Autophagy-related protein 29 n=1 Tax=Pholiota conissans TaxID=109636 RepID=A0A9P5YWI8_9AGAR|nr:hypothetical protein BDN70DRAFT_881696 [Pholiota conissans]